MDENGFYKTGDLAHIEEDGNYVIDGRVNEDCECIFVPIVSIYPPFKEGSY